MPDATPETRSITVEREFPHPPERVWRALTEPALVAEWFMQFDIQPVVGHRFGVTADWGSLECEVVAVETGRKLAYTWGDHDMDTVVTWTLEPTDTGTQLRMEQTGFRRDQPRYYGGAKAGWPRFFDKLEQLLPTID